MKRALLLISFVLLAACSQPEVEMVVYKSPTCGCCNKWITHLEQNGFKVIAKDMQDVTPVKVQNGLTPQLASCHTALVDGYVVEGHVPASDIKRLLKERPAVRGLSVPGMPVGSPGMEQGDRKDPYNVVTFNDKGETSIFSSY